MTNFIMDERGYQVWYDIESPLHIEEEKIVFFVKRKNDSNLYVRLHNENGPALIRNGSIYYCIRGDSHREDGPASILSDGSQYYYINGKLHREDGPAVILDGTNYWWFDGENYVFDVWCEKLNKSNEEINFLKLKWNIM